MSREFLADLPAQGPSSGPRLGLRKHARICFIAVRTNIRQSLAIAEASVEPIPIRGPIGKRGR